jgi:hypothetical protein
MGDPRRGQAAQRGLAAPGANGLTGATLGLVGLHFYHFSERPRIGEFLPGFFDLSASAVAASTL